jgi:hypothetical protein
LPWARSEVDKPEVRGVKLESLESGRPEMRQTLDRASQFLNLVALLAALLFLVFQAVFSWAVAPMDAIKAGVSWLSEGLTELLPEGIRIQGGQRFAAGHIDSHGDHRIAMAATISACISRNSIELTNASCVAKSYPDFFKDLGL